MVKHTQTIRRQKPIWEKIRQKNLEVKEGISYESAFIHLNT